MAGQGKIVITIVDEPDEDRFGIEVEVTGSLMTAEVIGYMEIAKLQHLDSKRQHLGSVYQSPDGMVD